MPVGALSFVFSLLAVIALGQVVRSLHARRTLPEVALAEDGARLSGPLLSMARTSAVVGAFFVAGAVAVWWSLPFGAVVGGLPLFAFAVFAATGNVDVISKPSKEE